MGDNAITLKTNTRASLLVRTFLLAIMVLLVSFTGHALANDDGLDNPDYDPMTGEPKCLKCHTADRSLSIDYMREESCYNCHEPGLSENYLSIHNRYIYSENPDTEKTEGSKPPARTEILLAAKTKKETVKKTKPPEDMAAVPAGEFTMGADDWWPKSQPAHKINLKAFYIDRYEVTNKRYKTFVSATGAPAPSHWPDGVIPKDREDHPVVFVSWFDASAFCKWEGKRLPTEAEWEKAARGADKRIFPWGDKFSKDKANTPQYGRNDTMPVGSFEQGKSPYKAYDMAGNAWEWVEDWFQPYPDNTHPDENYGEKYKVLRGGSWYDCTYYKCGISAPSFNRIFFHPSSRNSYFGFRCARDGD
ncbi:MAG: formylglycine-generating enzyme family protein [Deltaproteobacteria bacterium]|nr:formylglycine-generating enzyme family protein [Deltaproteobacteria bacterium]